MKFKPLVKDFLAPVYGSEEAAAFDIKVQEDVKLSKDPTLVKLGFSAAVPKGHVALLVPRSGLGSKQGTFLRNTVGVIDSDYRGEWMASLVLDNHEKPGMQRHLELARGDRAIQCLVMPVKTVEIEIVDELDDTARGEGGYGSTGLK